MNSNSIQRDSYEIQSEINLMRQKYEGSFLVVEGYSDFNLYKKFVIPNKCEVYPVYGNKDEGARDTILQSIKRMHRTPGILGIVDSDFSKINGEILEIPNIVLTDTHDIETLLIASDALDRIFEEYVDRAKLEQFEKDAKNKIREILLNSAEYIGLFVLYNNTKEYYLNFGEIDFLRFISTENLSIDRVKLIETVYDNSRKTLKNKDKILSDLEKMSKKMSKKGYDKWHLCRGHDLVEILYIGLKYIFGSYRAKNIDSPRKLEKELTFVYDCISFAKTDMYWSIREWESANTPFVICKNELKLCSHRPK